MDACLEQDPLSRVACETFCKTGFVIVGGEITTKARVDFGRIARETIKEIGYTSSAMGFDWERHRTLIESRVLGQNHTLKEIAAEVREKDPSFTFGQF